MLREETNFDKGRLSFDVGPFRSLVDLWQHMSLTLTIPHVASVRTVSRERSWDLEYPTNDFAPSGSPKARFSFAFLLLFLKHSTSLAKTVAQLRVSVWSLRWHPKLVALIRATTKSRLYMCSSMTIKLNWIEMILFHVKAIHEGSHNELTQHYWHARLWYISRQTKVGGGISWTTGTAPSLNLSWQVRSRATAA